MGDTRLDVYKLFLTEHVAWQDLEAASVDYYGRHIRQAAGPIVTAASMGRPSSAS
jgi:hypothetical protein